MKQNLPLSVYAADHNLPATLTVNQWTLMEKSAKVFEELTGVVSTETTTAADVIPAITVLKCVLSREHSTYLGIKTVKSTLLEAVDRRFSQVETELLYYIATLVDPRYKDRQVQYMYLLNAMIKYTHRPLY
ncbi:Zinc finger BED domain-containing protein 4 [Merluccius polli]|uniref:Zinc finger BED domain-containing protein 4 n=1 Tax=Merluccius polli TaxID=89951 RepID=A0AA47N456_MERPO|nr:Zinc finger BED domain-containing protein 4 [Merluccius polli]